jgi:hypothetical protein
MILSCYRIVPLTVLIPRRASKLALCNASHRRIPRSLALTHPCKRSDLTPGLTGRTGRSPSRQQFPGFEEIGRYLPVAEPPHEHLQGLTPVVLAASTPGETA